MLEAMAESGLEPLCNVGKRRHRSSDLALPGGDVGLDDILEVLDAWAKD